MINSVRNTVLAILNKNNYGYISPSDFNLFAKQAQLEIFEEYFSGYNDLVNKENARQSGTDYADQKKALEEAIELFAVTSTLTQFAPSANRYFLPSLTTTGFDYFMINKVLCYDGSGANRVFKAEAEKVTHGKITMLVNSNLTAPTENFPAYTQEGSILTVYPATFNLANEIDASYFRYPKDPKWTFTTLTNGEPVFNQSPGLGYQDFEVPVEDEIKLVSKILQYAGMSIRDIEAAQFGGIEEQKQSV
jgi:hypothetical protein